MATQNRIPRNLLVLWDSIKCFFIFIIVTLIQENMCENSTTHHVFLCAIPAMAFVSNGLVSLVVETDTPRVDEDWSRNPLLLDGCTFLSYLCQLLGNTARIWRMSRHSSRMDTQQCQALSENRDSKTLNVIKSWQSWPCQVVSRLLLSILTF